MTPLRPSFDNFVELSQKGNLVPVYTELAADYETPVSAYEKLTAGGIHQVSFLLESAESSEQIGRYSFIGVSPRIMIRAEGSEVTITESGKDPVVTQSDDPLREVENVMNRFQIMKLDNQGSPLRMKCDNNLIGVNA